MANVFLRTLAVGAVVLSVAYGVAAEEPRTPWTIPVDTQADVDAFLISSPIVTDMIRENEPNDLVYIGTKDGSALLPAYELLACLHLTNPKSKMTVDFGGGFDIDMDDVTFPGGVWPVYVRIREIERIDDLDKKIVLILDKIRIGNLTMRKTDIITKTMRVLLGACSSESDK